MQIGMGHNVRMKDSIARKQIDELKCQIIEIRKSMSAPLSPYDILSPFIPVERFHAVDIKERFDELYEFLKVKREKPSEKTKLVKT